MNHICCIFPARLVNPQPTGNLVLPPPSGGLAGSWQGSGPHHHHHHHHHHHNNDDQICLPAWSRLSGSAPCLCSAYTSWPLLPRFQSSSSLITICSGSYLFHRKLINFEVKGPLLLFRQHSNIIFLCPGHC